MAATTTAFTWAVQSAAHRPLPLGTPKAFYSVQAGSFLLRRNAEQLKISLDRDFEDVSIHGFQDAEDTYFRVRVGRYDSESEARKMAGTLERAGYSGFVVRVD